MHTFLQRANSVFAYALSVLATVTFLCFLTTVFLDYNSTANIKTVKVAVKNVPEFGTPKGQNELGVLTFDLETNLTGLFNWNVKQLFLYLTAEYKTEKNEINQVVLWDKIIHRGDNAMLNLKNMNTKYYFWNDGIGLRGHQNITLTLSYNLIPNAGLLPRLSSKGQHSFGFPSEYSATRI